uniref:Uncharacterized protein n=1 Tax=Anguilla anguilla TaxID=7936 RepID=A0A0E9QQG2_ANGAN
MLYLFFLFEHTLKGRSK